MKTTKNKTKNPTSKALLSECFPTARYLVYLLLSLFPEGLIKTRILPGLFLYGRETENTDLFLSVTTQSCVLNRRWKQLMRAANTLPSCCKAPP